MPTALRIGAYRLYFYSHETTEPPHIHIDRERFSAKFWLEPVHLSKNLGFNPKELRELQTLVSDNRKLLLEAWHGHFGASG
ncbi:MAG: DUF4160 domain-containing protein [Thermodesulfovibrionales bacterium]|nr:DUF4160 domain-containing protein [Thermodesulfovibrionales bacterium]